MKSPHAVLVLEDGSEFEGVAFGAATSSAGEVVFNTGMVGYPEAMTDPSYTGQILVCAYPLIGNYGVPSLGFEPNGKGMPDTYESSRIHVAGLVVSSLSKSVDHWSAQGSLDEWMRINGVPGISGVDTRAVTKRLRERGSMLGKIVVNGDVAWNDPNARHVVAEVSLHAPQLFDAGGSRRVALVDCGAKNNIVRSLLRRGVSVLKVPWDFDWTVEDIDGVVLSNGPGDPTFCGATVEIIRKGFGRDIPIFGICLGHQLLALAAGAETFKLKYGHRSQNQPCIQIGSQRCYITSQNHGFAVDPTSLDDDWTPWLFNANDGTNEGIRHKTRPFSSVQFHPEACPGPTDTGFLFDQFVQTLEYTAKTA